MESVYSVNDQLIITVDKISNKDINNLANSLTKKE